MNVFDGNLDLDLPNHLALINLFDPNTGTTSCVMDGTYITAIRTAAAAALAARMLSRKQSRIATVIGAGVQGREQLRLLPLIGDLEHVHVCSTRFDDAEKLAARSKIARATTDVEAAVRESDIVCLATNSPTPVIKPEWIKPGTHVSSVGYCPPNGELPKDLARSITFLSKRWMLFSRLRSGAANSLGWMSPRERLSERWLLVEDQAALAMMR